VCVLVGVSVLFNHFRSYHRLKVKGKGQVLDIALLHDEHMLRSALQSKAAADWHELMIAPHIIRPSIAHAI